MTTPNQGVLPALSSHSLHSASILALIQMTTLLPSPCPVLGWEMTDFEKVPKEENTVQGQQGCQPSPTYLCCQVVPRGQVLEPEEAVPVASSTPAGIVLHHLQGQEHTWNAAQSPLPAGSASSHVQGAANTTRGWGKTKPAFLCGQDCAGSALSWLGIVQFMN